MKERDLENKYLKCFKEVSFLMPKLKRRSSGKPLFASGNCKDVNTALIPTEAACSRCALISSIVFPIPQKSAVPLNGFI